jgi:hypothetical protein
VFYFSDDVSRIQPQIWDKIKDYLSDYHKSLSFFEVDCCYQPEMCHNFPNEKLPSYVVLNEHIMISACSRPKNFDELRVYLMEHLGKRYRKKKNYVADPKIKPKQSFPDLNGVEVFADDFAEKVKEGHSFVE